jgi:hypothetical protein
MFEAGDALDKISGALGRQPGSIAARLKKHYGEEVALPR